MARHTRFKVEHACDVCGTLFWADSGARAPACPACGTEVAEEDWDEPDDSEDY